MSNTISGPSARSRVDCVALFDRLAAAMNVSPDRYEVLGDVNLDLALVMRRARDDGGGAGDGGDPTVASRQGAGSEPGDAFRVLLGFRGIGCETVAELEPGQERSADCWLEADLADWRSMFADIVANGRATGPWTLNTLTIFGERFQLHATDPMGWDKFHRFNQTLQEFFDAAATQLDNPVTEEARHAGT